jgi:hypothetical protein
MQVIHPLAEFEDKAIEDGHLVFQLLVVCGVGGGGAECPVFLGGGGWSAPMSLGKVGLGGWTGAITDGAGRKRKEELGSRGTSSKQLKFMVGGLREEELWGSGWEWMEESVGGEACEEVEGRRGLQGEPRRGLPLKRFLCLGMSCAGLWSPGCVKRGTAEGQ